MKINPTIVLTDEAIDFYGEKYQSSEEKQKGIPFEIYLNERVRGGMQLDDEKLSTSEAT